MHGYGYDAKAEAAQTERPYYPEEATMMDRPPSHVSSSLLSVDTEGQHLLEAIHELERRLGDVLRPEIETSVKGLSEPRPALVPLAERLEAQVSTIRSARAYVVSILERLEL